MKLLVFFSLLIVAALCQDKCIEFGPGVLYCHSFELKADEPFYTNNSYSIIFLAGVSGSIGHKTLSPLTRLQQLRIEGSNISMVEDGAICSLPNLETIGLSRNGKFPKITDSIFGNCEKLMFLQAGDVEIEPTAFKKLTNLKALVLERLHIERLREEFLKPLSRLEGLKIDECEIKEIDSGSLCSSSGLKAISMTNNKYLPPLTEKMFENCKNLKDFNYEFNPVSSLEEKTFNGFINLESLDTDYLKIDHLSRNHLAGLSKLNYVRFDNSDMKTIEMGAFHSLVNLQRLVLRDNHLREINTSVFSPLVSLMELFLGDNSIESIDSFMHTNLLLLDVSRNNISKIDAEAVKQNLPKLRRLAAGLNKMTPEYEESLRKKFKSYNIEF